MPKKPPEVPIMPDIPPPPTLLDEDQDGQDVMDEVLRTEAPLPVASAMPSVPVGFMDDVLGGAQAAQQDRRQEPEPALPHEPQDPMQWEVVPATEHHHPQRTMSDAIDGLFGPWQEDFRVEVHIMQIAGGGKLIERGFMPDMLASYARVPMRYIRYGGPWHIEFTSISGPRKRYLGAIDVRLPGKLPPEDYRVEDDDMNGIDYDKLAAAIRGDHATTPLDAFKGGMGEARTELDRLRKENETLKENQRVQSVTEAVKAAVAPLSAELAAVKARLDGGGGAAVGGGTSQERMVDRLCDTLTKVAAQGGGSGGGDSGALKMLADLYGKTTGPDAIATVASLYNEMLKGMKTNFEAAMAGGGKAAADSWTPERIGALALNVAGAIGKVNETLIQRREAIVKEMQRRTAAGGKQQEAVSRQQPESTQSGPRAAVDLETQRVVGMISNRRPPAMIARAVCNLIQMVDDYDIGTEDANVGSMMQSLKDDPVQAMAIFAAAYGGTAEIGAEIGKSLKLLLDAESGNGQGTDGVKAVPAETGGGEHVGGADAGAAPADGVQRSSA